ncbi:DUF6873 family GME fold protein [Microaceticoccus formicicus]|uniref:DUF6873 family GME fold protein n=1 Tax=Microaceticoccus formicicus TaxID=3118105 RepID=UPI003CD04C4A|nr:hypothetical protein VZL98_05695 [Peptoniphilaceae bacterium AMB_02]
MKCKINPFITKKNIKTILISNKISDKLRLFITNLNINIIESVDNKSLPNPVSDHPDMSIHPINSNVFMVDVNVFSDYQDLLSNYPIDIIPSNDALGEMYPYDSLLNVSRIGNYFIHNNYTSDDLIRWFNNLKFEHLPVKQGYSKCSTLILNCDTIVTSDKGIHKAIISKGLNSYLIPPGGIELKGYDTGFIGGTGGMISPDTLLLSGDLELYEHGEFLKIILDDLKIKAVYPKDEKLVDLGSIILID